MRVFFMNMIQGVIMSLIYVLIFFFKGQLLFFHKRDIETCIDQYEYNNTSQMDIVTLSRQRVKGR
jgi:hypothetical protein